MDRELYKKHIIEMLDSLSDDKIKLIANIVARHCSSSAFDKEAIHE